MRHLITAILSLVFVSGCVVETTGHSHSNHKDHYHGTTVYYPGTVRIYFIDTHPNRFCPPGHAYRGYCYLDKPDYDRAVKDPKWEKQAREKANQQQRQQEKIQKDKEHDDDKDHDDHEHHDGKSDDKQKSPANKPKEGKEPEKGKKRKD